MLSNSFALLYIYLYYSDSCLLTLLFNIWRNHLARAAPRSIEVYHNRVMVSCNRQKFIKGLNLLYTHLNFIRKSIFWENLQTTQSKTKIFTFYKFKISSGILYYSLYFSRQNEKVKTSNNGRLLMSE